MKKPDKITVETLLNSDRMYLNTEVYYADEVEEYYRWVLEPILEDNKRSRSDKYKKNTNYSDSVDELVEAVDKTIKRMEG